MPESLSLETLRATGHQPPTATDAGAMVLVSGPLTRQLNKAPVFASNTDVETNAAAYA
jgi:hypothetical protein